MKKKITALVGCQEQDCARNKSLSLDMVRMWEEQPICEICYDDTTGVDALSWWDLPGITLSDLTA